MKSRGYLIYGLVNRGSGVGQNKRPRDRSMRFGKTSRLRYSSWFFHEGHPREHKMSVEARLAELRIILPPAPKPVASYVSAVRAGDLLFLSGTGPFKDGKVVYTGKLGKDLTVEQGYEAAKLTLLNALAIVKQELGSLNQIKRVVRMSGHVASAEGFTQQPQVLNGASDLLVEIFGEAGRHARLALGAAELPLNMAIELELILQVR